MISVEIFGGETILVPEYDNVLLPDGRKLRLSKITPFNQLLYLWKDKKGNLFIHKAGSYEEALYISGESRRCLFCNSSGCVHQGIAAFGSRDISPLFGSGAYETDESRYVTIDIWDKYLISAHRCQRYEKHFISVFEVRSLLEGLTECPACGSKYGFENVRLEEHREEIQTDFLLFIKHGCYMSEDFRSKHYSGQNLDEMLDWMLNGYQCKNCKWKFDRSFQTKWKPIEKGGNSGHMQEIF